MTAAAITTFREGFRRVSQAPALVAGVFALNLLIALPLAFVMRDTLASYFASSQRADEALREMNTDWWGEFHDARGDGIGATLQPSVIGFAAVLRNLSDLLDAEAPDVRLVGPIAAWLVLWTFLAGGIITRYARRNAVHAQGFFGACGHHLFRLLRLGIGIGIVYVLLFRWIHPLLFETIEGRLTHDLSVERTAFFIRLLLYAIFGLLLTMVHVFADAARVRAVVEDRRSMIGAALAGLRLLRANWRQVLGLYALTGAALLVLWLVYALVATSGRGAGVWVWLALIVGQLYLLGRLWLKLQLLASLVVLYQTSLGGKTESGGAARETDADATPIWPESPAADPL